MNITDEILVRVDKTDKIIGEVKRRELHSSKDLFIRVVVVTVFNPKGQILFGIKNKRINNPTWSIVGSGHISINEEPLEAGLRELAEESGIIADPGQLEFKGKRFDDDLGYGTYVYHYSIFLNEEIKFQENNEEFNNYKWMTISELKASDIPMSFGTTKFVNDIEK